MYFRRLLTQEVCEAFAACGFDRKYGEVVLSYRPDLCQFQCNGALAAAKQYQQSAYQIAQTVVEQLSTSDIVETVTVAGQGFINITVTDDLIVSHMRSIAADERLGCDKVQSRNVLIDYGGANVAKPMHVGHLRAAIIGEGLKRLLRFKGHNVLGDIHLGDWGLPMGIVLAELQRRYPEWLYFDANYRGPYPSESPVTIDDLEEIYPVASRLSSENQDFREAAKRATLELQNGRPGYRALWKHFVEVSVVELQRDYADLNIEFDLWLGESDTQDRIASLIEYMLTHGYAYESKGAIIVDVSLPDDKHEIPPLILVKSDGAVLYATTDLATVQQRIQDLNSEVLLYVVDKRQSTHFEQVFRAARRTGIVPASAVFKHIGFGTMNGKDGKPFKTRAGGVLKLRSLIQMVTDKALEKLPRDELEEKYTETERIEIAHKIGIAALKFADLSNYYAMGYVFDLDRFLLLEGRTGSYLLYTVTRTKSILRKAAKQKINPGLLQMPASEVERWLLLKFAELPDVLNTALENYALNHLCDYAYEISTLYNQFYHQHHILSATDSKQQESWLSLSSLFVRILELVLDLLGIPIPQRM